MTPAEGLDDEGEREAALAMLQAVVAANPDLGVFGWLAPRGGAREAERRELELAEPETLDAFLVSLAFIRRFCRPTATSRRGQDSYILKHMVERWHQRSGRPCYAPNGVFIAAALALGFRCQRGPGARNSRFDMARVRIPEDAI